ncbi:hypothetical protein P170DRAFT_344400 [Aspergillus steynii IBT 23096]|uniref:Uncharacterized protein n=1 Tax=Aspergillus steynii IBT 23096 TaxID=1392250 RepID=A0A2I2GP06_9EURO|nr:uncharacterized protein P170DRAFT_344400 [Aspergillus steynii IBT 23096]PLB54604.1 hypothetical protein P170DRAFT_344400 [Aspergillus steynii IBT 23096]
MYLPQPTYTFTIPSVYDGIQLDCRLHVPRQLSAPENPHRGPISGAIVAHPYATLGGCYDDPVVNFVGSELLDAGYVLGTFNFRGAGESEGSTSWTARPELADYVSFYGFMLCYLQLLRTRLISSNPEPEDTVDTTQTGSGEGPAKIHLVLGGYSYGSMIASHLPAIGVIADLFENSTPETASYQIRREAEKVFALSSDIQKSPDRLSASPEASNSKGALRISRARISYLLISPLLPPINMFLTVFSKLSLIVGAQTSAEGRHIPCPKPTDQLRANPTLAIYGSHDTFTSTNKLRQWSEELARVPGSQFQSAEIDGAGHFWREHGAESEARATLREWLRQIH